MSKIIISPAQAILILIEHYRNQSPNNVTDVKNLEFLYLDGVRNPGEKYLLTLYFKNNEASILKDYTVSLEPSVINNDPSRRYFETNLAFETLRNDLNSIDIYNLRTYVNNLKMFFNHYEPNLNTDVLIVLEGKYSGENNLYNEYSEYMRQINEGELFNDAQKFNSQKREIIQLFIISSFLAVLCAQSAAIGANDPMPLNIYGTDLYALDKKGKIMLPQTPAEDQNHSGNTRNQHYGLMKGHMPLYQDDVLLAKNSYSHLKASDQATYDINADWNKLSFYRMVHPYSNSISGTALCQLRSLAYFKQKNVPVFLDNTEKFASYFKLFISTISFYSGGHSLFEFVYPLSLQAVTNEFNLTGIDFSSINLTSLFTQNRASMDKALNSAISYNNMFLKRKMLQQELTEYAESSGTKALNLLSAKKMQSLLLLNIDTMLNDDYTTNHISPNCKDLFKELSVNIEQFKFNEALDIAIKINPELSFNVFVESYFNDIATKLSELNNYYGQYNQRLFSLASQTPEVRVENKIDSYAEPGPTGKRKPNRGAEDGNSIVSTKKFKEEIQVSPPQLKK